MLQGSVIILVALLYIGVLFAIAYYGDKRADAGRSMINNPYIYALSMGVYCTTWTYYGSVGRAANFGVSFLPIYLGPTLLAALWWFVLRKMIRISKVYHITSIADLVASRYGKSTLLGGLVTVIAVLGIIPYISLQLDAVSMSFTLLWNYPQHPGAVELNTLRSGELTVFYVALTMAVFAMLFGTRHVDVTEHHEGLVAAIAFESVVKVVAVLASGVFVTYVMFNGVGDLFGRAAGDETLRQLFRFDATTGSALDWMWLTVLSMLAVLFLPRQFQMAVIENMSERHLDRASWLFPLYLLVINLFVLPIAIAGRLVFGSSVDADTFVLTLPMYSGQEALALFVFIGGFSAAASMVIVETVALSTMVSNDLILPFLLRLGMANPVTREGYGRTLLVMRRVTILVIVLLGYAYYTVAGGIESLVSIGLISFAAVAQFAPAVLGGMYWKGGTRWGALAGLVAGFAVWAYTLSLPSLRGLSMLPESFITAGPWGIDWLRPYALFGLQGLDKVSHAMFWSMLANIGLYVGVSLTTQPNAIEHSQAARFVDVFASATDDAVLLWRGTASVAAIRSVLERFLGDERTERTLAAYSRRHGVDLCRESEAGAELVQYAERTLAGVMGAASARVAIASAVQEEVLSIGEVLRMLDETSQVLAYSRQLEERSHQLEKKSLELEAATAELRAANEQLHELDRLKDDFISTVTHELRTPLTSIRAFTEILSDNPDLDQERRSQFLTIVLKESERLTRLINQVLDLAKIESGAAEWHTSEINVVELMDDAVKAAGGLFDEQKIAVSVDLPGDLPVIMADRDRMMQVVMNLLSNAAKFCDRQQGKVSVRAAVVGERLRVDVTDNGPGITAENQAVIFDKFRQTHESGSGKPQGTGLGLPISRQIIAHYGGDLWVESVPGKGATFSFTLPLIGYRG